MLVNNCLLSKPFSADTTLEWFLSCVLPHVNFQVSRLFEGFSTVLAVERPAAAKSVSSMNKVTLSPDCIVLSHVLH